MTGDLIRPETDTDVAEKLGVSQPVVHRVVNNIDANIIYHERMRARLGGCCDCLVI